MERIGGDELGGEIANDPRGEQEIGGAVAQRLAIGAHGVEIQERALDPA